MLAPVRLMRTASKSFTRAACLGTALALTLAHVPLTHAQPAEASAANSPEARASALIDEGVQLRIDGKEQEAYERFKQAHDTFASPRAAGQLGMVERALRLFLDAERHLHEALAGKKDAWVIKNEAALRKNLDIVERNLGWLQVETNVPDAELVVNGSDTAKLPLKEPLRVVAGASTVEVSAQGYEAAQRDVTVRAKKTASVVIELKPLAAEPQSSDPQPKPEPEPPKDAGPKDEDDSPNIAAYVIGGVGLVGVGFGTFFGLEALDKKKERDSYCQNGVCTAERGVDADQEGRDAATLSTISFSVGIVGLGVAAVMLLTGGGGESQASRPPPLSLDVGAREVRLRGVF